MFLSPQQERSGNNSQEDTNPSSEEKFDQRSIQEKVLIKNFIKNDEDQNPSFDLLSDQLQINSQQKTRLQMTLTQSELENSSNNSQRIQQQKSLMSSSASSSVRCESSKPVSLNSSPQQSDDEDDVDEKDIKNENIDKVCNVLLKSRPSVRYATFMQQSNYTDREQMAMSTSNPRDRFMRRSTTIEDIGKQMVYRQVLKQPIVNLKGDQDQEVMIQVLQTKVKSEEEIQYIVKALKSMPIMQTMEELIFESKETQLYLSKSVTHRQYEKDEVLFYQGDFGYEYFIVLTGSVYCLIDLPEEEEEDEDEANLLNLPEHEYYLKTIFPNKKLVATFTPGMGFGEIALINKSRRTATMVCGKDCDLLVMNKFGFDKVLRIGYQKKMKEKMDFIKHYSWFHRIPESLLESFFYDLEPQKFNENVKLYQEKDAVNNIYLLLKGQVEISENHKIMHHPNQQQQDTKNQLQNDMTQFNTALRRKTFIVEQKKIPIIVYTDGSFFGDLEITKKQTTRRTTAKTKSEILVYILDKKKLFQFLKMHYQTEPFKQECLRKYEWQQKRLNNVLEQKKAQRFCTQENADIEQVTKFNKETKKSVPIVIEKNNFLRRQKTTFDEDLSMKKKPFCFDSDFEEDYSYNNDRLKRRESVQFQFQQQQQQQYKESNNTNTPAPQIPQKQIIVKQTTGVIKKSKTVELNEDSSNKKKNENIIMDVQKDDPILQFLLPHQLFQDKGRREDLQQAYTLNKQKINLAQRNAEEKNPDQRQQIRRLSCRLRIPKDTDIDIPINLFQYSNNSGDVRKKLMSHYGTPKTNEKLSSSQKNKFNFTQTDVKKSATVEKYSNKKKSDKRMKSQREKQYQKQQQDQQQQYLNTDFDEISRQKGLFATFCTSTDSNNTTQQQFCPAPQNVKKLPKKIQNKSNVQKLTPFMRIQHEKQIIKEIDQQLQELCKDSDDYYENEEEFLDNFNESDMYNFVQPQNTAPVSRKSLYRNSLVETKDNTQELFPLSDMKASFMNNMSVQISNKKQPEQQQQQSTYQSYSVYQTPQYSNNNNKQKVTNENIFYHSNRKINFQRNSMITTGSSSSNKMLLQNFAMKAQTQQFNNYYEKKQAQKHFQDARKFQEILNKNNNPAAAEDKIQQIKNFGQAGKYLKLEKVLKIKKQQKY